MYTKGAAQAAPFYLLDWNNREMCYLLDVIHKSVVVCLLPLITVPISAGDVIHNKVDVYIIRVGMERIDHLVIRFIIRNYFLGKTGCLLECNMLILTKTEH